MLPSVTHTLLNNGPKSSSTPINTNFQDLVNAFSDGTKDLNVAAIAAAAAVTANISAKGSAALSSSLTVSDDVTMTGALTSSDVMSVKKFSTSNTVNYDLGSTSTIVPVQSNFTINSILYNAGNFSDGIEIDVTNNKVDFQESAGELTATITPGTYTPAALATEIETQMNAVGVLVYAVIYSATSGFVISNTTDTEFSFLFRTGTNYLTTTGKSIGFDVTSDKTDANTYSSEYVYQIDYYDELATITPTNFTDNDIVLISVESTLNSVSLTVKNGTGNINCGSDRTLTQDSKIAFVYDLATTSWNMLYYTAN